MSDPAATKGAVIVGAGPAGLLHALSYRAHGVPVRMVHDPDLDRAHALAELTGATVVRTLDEVRDAPWSFASVASPPVVHAEQVARIARDGRVVLVEKPVATTIGDLEILAALPSVVPVLQWRAGRAIIAIRRAIERGFLGPRPTAAVDLSLLRDADYMVRTGSRAGWGCGALLSVGIHAIDAVVWALGGRVRRVTGALVHARPVDVETGAVMTLELEGGSLASVRVTFDGGADRAAMCFSGGGISAEIRGSEQDLTAGQVAWLGADDRVISALRGIEARVAAPAAPPLVVPYIGDVIRACSDAEGAVPRPPSIADTRDAHLSVLTLYERVSREATRSSDV